MTVITSVAPYTVPIYSKMYQNSVWGSVPDLGMRAPGLVGFGGN